MKTSPFGAIKIAPPAVAMLYINVQFVMTTLPSNTNIMLSASPSIKRMKQTLQDFKDEDYLLLIGDPAAIGVACSVASYYNRGRYNILKWDRQEGTYYPVQIDLHEKGEI